MQLQVHTWKVLFLLLLLFITDSVFKCVCVCTCTSSHVHVGVGTHKVRRECQINRTWRSSGSELPDVGVWSWTLDLLKHSSVRNCWVSSPTPMRAFQKSSKFLPHVSACIQLFFFVLCPVFLLLICVFDLGSPPRFPMLTAWSQDDAIGRN